MPHNVCSDVRQKTEMRVMLGLLSKSYAAFSEKLQTEITKLGARMNLITCNTKYSSSRGFEPVSYRRLQIFFTEFAECTNTGCK
jgi:hypothetical protein